MSNTFNCVFAYPDFTLNGTLTNGNGSYPFVNLDNLKNPLRGKKAYVVSPNSAKVRVDFGSNRSVGVVALIGHTASYAATVRVSLYNNSDYSESHMVAESSTYGSARPKLWFSPWYADGVTDITSDDVASYLVKPDYWCVFSSNVSVRYMQIEITDTGNTQFQLGRVFAGTKYVPTINMDYGAGFSWKDDVISDKALGGVEWNTVLSQGREITAAFSSLNEVDSQTIIMNRQRLLGTTGHLYFIYDPTSITGLLRTKSMLCTFGENNPITAAAYGSNQHSFTLKEVR